MSEYILRSLKQKIEKWTKFITGDERVILKSIKYTLSVVLFIKKHNVPNYYEDKILN